MVKRRWGNGLFQEPERFLSFYGIMDLFSAVAVLAVHDWNKNSISNGLRSIPCSEYMSEEKEYRFPDRLARPTDNASIADQRGSKESVLLKLYS